MPIFMSVRRCRVWFALFCALTTPFFCGPQVATSQVMPSQALIDGQELPQFEVATIKPTIQDNYKPHGIYVYPGGRIRAKQSTLKMLIEFAFDLKEFQVVGGPGWVGQDLYDLEALPPDTSPSRQSNPKFINAPPGHDQRQMLQSLLIERFGLRFLRRMKEASVYLLVKGERTLKLDDANRKDAAPLLAIGGHGYGGMTGKTVSMSYVAARLSTYLDRLVIDQTGLAGVYDFKLEPLASDSPTQSNDNFLDGIFQSMDQLGLRLKLGKAQVETLTIQAATRPTAN